MSDAWGLQPPLGKEHEVLSGRPALESPIHSCPQKSSPGTWVETGRCRSAASDGPGPTGAPGGAIPPSPGAHGRWSLGEVATQASCDPPAPEAPKSGAQRGGRPAPARHRRGGCRGPAGWPRRRSGSGPPEGPPVRTGSTTSRGPSCYPQAAGWFDPRCGGSAWIGGHLPPSTASPGDFGPACQPGQGAVAWTGRKRVPGAVT
mmetsp:Transcript_93368/g.213504  ORF Transcript_93368/g.213504 Transcript_93368/m.213504 type:complete len:203 (+) Transcript_93368:353-961(+)